MKQRMAQIRIGDLVTVTVDRPMHSHHPDYPDLVYPINYGYIEGVPAADGEDQDAYILGVDFPLKSFTGRVKAVIHRRDDVEDKLVVAPDELELTEQKIIDATAFKEQYFDISIRMTE